MTEKEQMVDAVHILRRLGYVPSADGKTWVPPLGAKPAWVNTMPTSFSDPGTIARHEADRRAQWTAIHSGLNAVQHELVSAMARFKPFNSAHEAYAVLAEEVDELWDEVKVRQDKRDYARMEKECIQVAAMAVRMLVEVVGSKTRGQERITRLPDNPIGAGIARPTHRCEKCGATKIANEGTTYCDPCMTAMVRIEPTITKLPDKPIGPPNPSERVESDIELAKIQGRKLAPNEGFSGVDRVELTTQGKAKIASEYPDLGPSIGPFHQALDEEQARKKVEEWKAAYPEIATKLDETTAILTELLERPWTKTPPDLRERAEKILERLSKPAPVQTTGTIYSKAAAPPAPKAPCWDYYQCVNCSRHVHVHPGVRVYSCVMCGRDMKQVPSEAPPHKPPGLFEQVQSQDRVHRAPSEVAWNDYHYVCQPCGTTAYVHNNGMVPVCPTCKKHMALKEAVRT